MTRSTSSSRSTANVAPASKPTSHKVSKATTPSRSARGAKRSDPGGKLVKATFPAEFECSSGELLWGQVNTIIEGFNNATVDTPSGPKERLTGGTIMQNNFSYRVAAKQGTWKVREVQVGDYAIVHVCHHESMDATRIVQRVANVGISNAQQHGDKRIVYVNRYDWSWQHRPGAQLVQEALGGSHEGDEEDEDDTVGSLVGARFLLVDKDGYDTFLATLRRRPAALRQNNYTLVAADSSAAFGIHVSDPDTEYELGWMVFGDGEERDTLLAFVYDGAYCVLGEDDDAPLTMEGAEIPRLPNE
ncbi:hypothetical protein ATCC90586_010211 [Pythium insidiosum]|nr:hypothetical protein ATCC90586_010211 [Pythium insidiosum]